MPRRLSKQESRQRWKEARNLWNAFDPIGVAHAVDDEYESYIGPSLRILECDGSIEELMSYLQKVFDHMGLVMNEPAALKFVDQLKTWWDSRWHDTYV